MAQSMLAKRLGLLRKNLSNLIGVSWGWFFKALYHCGLPLSIVYGKFHQIVFELESNFDYRVYRNVHQTSNADVFLLLYDWKRTGINCYGNGRTTRWSAILSKFNEKGKLKVLINYTLSSQEL